MDIELKEDFFESRINDTLDEIKHKKDVLQNITEAKAKINEAEEREAETRKSFLEEMDMVNIIEIPMSVRVKNGLKH